MSQFEQLFKEAHNYYKLQNYENALEKLEKAEKVFVSTDNDGLNLEDLLIFKGGLFYSIGDLEKAQDTFEQVLQNNTQSIEACMGIGKVYFSAEMFKEAKIMFEWACNINPEDKNASSYLALVNNRLGLEADHNSLLIDDTDEPIKERRNFNVLFDNSYDLFLDNNFNEALNEVIKLEKSFIEDTKMLKGNIYLATEDYDNCKIEFEEVIKVNPKSVAAYNGLAKMYIGKNMFKEAKAMYEFALKINPDDSFSTMGLAEVNEKLGFSPIHSFYVFLTDKKISEEVNEYLEKAFNYFTDKKHEECIEQLTYAEKLVKASTEEKKNESLSSILNFKGFNYLALSRLEEAKSTFEFSLRLNPGSSQACAGLGEYFYLIEQDKEAKTMFEWAVKNNPDNLFAVQGLAKVNKLFNYPLDHSSLNLGIPEEINDEFVKLVTDAYSCFDKKEFTKAIDLIERAIKLLIGAVDEIKARQQLVSLTNFKGFNYLSLGENKKAKECFEFALESNPSSSQASAGLGEILYLEGKDGEAKTMFEYALKYEPRNSFAIAGLKKTNKILGLPENDNSLTPKIKKDKSEKIGNLIDEAYKSFNSKKYEEIIPLLDEAEKLVEENFSREENYETVTRINNFKGFSLLALDEGEKAKTCFEKALQLSPNSSQACAGLAEVFYLAGKDEESKVMFEWALKNNATNNYALAGLKKVNTALGLSEDHNSLAE
ncbi:MAG TPA: tetratricopeptide repeat protein [Melioribacteraceae bacterium]|nr:tetratricopeptide repeat protein [Melioribacteraceae bacterium]